MKTKQSQIANHIKSTIIFVLQSRQLFQLKIEVNPNTNIKSIIEHIIRNITFSLKKSVEQFFTINTQSLIIFEDGKKKQIQQTQAEEKRYVYKINKQQYKLITQRGELYNDIQQASQQQQSDYQYKAQQIVSVDKNINQTKEIKNYNNDTIKQEQQLNPQKSERLNQENQNKQIQSQKQANKIDKLNKYNQIQNKKLEQIKKQEVAEQNQNNQQKQQKKNIQKTEQYVSRKKISQQLKNRLQNQMREKHQREKKQLERIRQLNNKQMIQNLNNDDQYFQQIQQQKPEIKTKQIKQTKAVVVDDFGCCNDSKCQIF